MRAEIIAIGDELICGQRLDTNTPWLSQQMADLGIICVQHTTIGDDLAVNVRALRDAFDRADVIVTTGGLGPTQDDLTREALAEATGALLEHIEELETHIRHLFERRGRKMPDRNLVQAMLPAGSQAIPNPNGTAPGVQVVVKQNDNKCHVFALPGVPSEMKEMWHGTVAPAITAMSDGQPKVVVHRTLRCFGAGESAIEERLFDLTRRGREPVVGITASSGTISLRVTAAGSDATACHAVIKPTADAIYQRLGDLVFGEDDDMLQHAVAKQLHDRGQSLVTAEWGTDGLISRWLASVPNVSSVFRGGLSFSNAESAFRWLQSRVGATVCDRDLPKMAEVLRLQRGADWALIAGDLPSGEEDPLAPRTLHVVFAGDGIDKQFERPYSAHPAIVADIAAKHALNTLRLELA